MFMKTLIIMGNTKQWCNTEIIIVIKIIFIKILNVNTDVIVILSF